MIIFLIYKIDGQKRGEPEKDMEFKKRDPMDDRVENILPADQLTTVPIDVIKFGHDSDFLMLQMRLSEHITGMLLVDDTRPLLDTGRHNVILVNSNLDEAQKRHVIAHELGHYYLEYKKGQRNQLVYEERDREHLDDLREMNAERFARSLLMPYEKFKKSCLEKMNNHKVFDQLVSEISDEFWVTSKKVKDRLKDLGLEKSDFESGTL